MDPAKRTCWNCGDWRLSLLYHKTCLCQRSPNYQQATAPDETCKYFSLRGTSGSEMRTELNRRQQMAEKSRRA